MISKDFHIDADTKFVSPTYGDITLRGAVDTMIDKFMAERPDAHYDIAVGTDSMTYDFTKFALAIVIHRQNNGGIYFHREMMHPKYHKNQLQMKLVQETQTSLDAAKVLLDLFQERGINVLDPKSHIHFCVHIDAGEYGPTKDYLTDLIGWIVACGYDCETKPKSYAASVLADRCSK
jgi:predicted RNase H-related nuclease YkuK (DUF458 family)